MILEYFFSEVAGLSKDWNAEGMLSEALEFVKVAQHKKVLCAFSG